MAQHESLKQQDENMAKLIISAFRRLDDKGGGVSPHEITKYLQDKFGDIWSSYNLTKRAEETLKRSAALGFLNKRGDRYLESVAREMCGRRRRRCRCRRRRRKRCCRRRRRRRCACG
ncbi:uncharacterized protein LOC119835766 [Zerene cesonia]|uniref:uncharacterized protein LOC119835766 n=1 Tax=Zerene cesonia TaxID=33412 RepID=UPI0018E4F357|nr:uncharacterized protein LOC119835766 [Zerene cesonia]